MHGKRSKTRMWQLPDAVALGALCWSLPAMAAALEPLARVELPEPAHHLSVLPDGSGLVVVGAEGTRLVDPRTARVSGRIGPGGRAGVVRDLDQDGQADLVVCTDTGLVHSELGTSGWSPPARLDRTPCQDLVVVGERLLVVGTVTRWLAPDLSLAEVAAVRPGRGRLMAALDGEEWRIASVGGRTIYDGDGKHTLDEAIGGLAWTPAGLAWSVPGDARVQLGDEAHPVGPAPEGLLTLTGPDGYSLAVLHPATGELGILTPGTPELRVDVGQPVRVARAWDHDGDGCQDIVWAEADAALQVHRGQCGLPDTAAGTIDPWAAPPAEPPPHVKPRPPREKRVVPREKGPRLGGAQLPVLAGYTHTGPPPARFAFRSVRVSVGLTTFRPFLSASAFFPLRTTPSAAAIFEFGTWNTRVYFGASTAPLALGIDNDTGVPYWHLLVGRLGVAWGNDRLRVGAHANLGIIAAGLGVRIVAEPIQFKRVRMGFDLYLDVQAQGLAEAGLLWGWTFPRAGDAAQARRWKDGTPGCRRVTIGLGGGATVGSTRFSWQYVGSEVDVAVTGGPAITGTCEGSGSGSVHPFLGLSTAPWNTWAGPSDQDLAHLGTLDAGVMFGGPAFSAGLHASAGVLMIGGGARVLWLPLESNDGARAGLELRASMLYPSSPAGEALLLFTAAWDPRPLR